MKKIIILFTTMLMLLSLLGCSGDNAAGSDAVDKDINNNDVELSQLSDFVNENDYQTIRKADSIYNEFAYKSFKKVITRNENEIYSPFSIYNALAVLSNGAGGNSRKHLENLLGMTVNDVNKYLKKVNDGNYNSYNLLNGIWLDNGSGIDYKQEFLDTASEYYGSVVKQLNFKDHDILASDINDWADEATDGRISELVKADEISDDSAFFIVNALTAVGYWITPFDANFTYLGSFKNYDGSLGSQEMMHDLLWYYMGNDTCEGIELATDRNLTFIALMPTDDKDIYEFVDTLNEELINDLLDSKVSETNYKADVGVNEWGPYSTADRHFTILSLPKFEYSRDYDLEDAFGKLGIADLFDYTTADFSNMSTNAGKLLFIKNIKQKDTILVDEEKVEAAAVSTLEGGLGAVGENMVYTDYFHYMDFNKPFVYLLMSGDKVLFIGLMSNIEEDASLIKLKVTAEGKIKVRSDHSTSADQLSYYIDGDNNMGLVVYEGDIVYAYDKVAAGGYTWYKLGDRAWIADKDGEWLKVIN